MNPYRRNAKTINKMKKRNDMNIGEKYNWKNQPERLIYKGKIGVWHQFVQVSNPDVIWCEVLEEDLHMIEKTMTTKEQKMRKSFRERLFKLNSDPDFREDLTGMYLNSKVRYDWELYQAAYKDCEAEFVQVAWRLNTGHGTAISEDKPPCEIDKWKPLFARKTE